MRSSTAALSWISVVAALVLVAPSTRADDGHEHEGDIAVGWTDFGVSGGPKYLATEFHYDEEHTLPPIGGPVLWGWLGDEPGFDHLHEDMPDEDFYTLDPGAEVIFEVLAIDDGLNIWTPGFGETLTVGDTFVLGDEELHRHLGWHIDATIPGVDPELYTYSATFRLSDSGTTGYGISEAYTLTFVPEPATALLALAGAIVRRCRP